MLVFFSIQFISVFLFSAASAKAPETLRHVSVCVAGTQVPPLGQCGLEFPAVVPGATFRGTSYLWCAPDKMKTIFPGLVVYRHGDRTSITTYPKDPDHISSLPGDSGRLTKIGMCQQFALGEFLRSEYDGFLSATYQSTEILVQSADVGRCLKSAYCNLASLYPSCQHCSDDNLSPQSIPVHTVPQNEDDKLVLFKPCLRFDELYDEVLHQPEVQEEERVNAGLYRLLERETGMTGLNISNLWTVADPLIVQKAHHLPLPDWAQQKWQDGTVFSQMITLRDWSFVIMFQGSGLSRLKGGPLLKELLQNMQTAVDSADGQHYKMHMYSAQDITILAVLSAMSVHTGVTPPYASTVLVELHEINGAHCVKIRFRNDSTGLPPHILQHPQCQQSCCPLDRYVEVTKDRVPVDWEEECKNSPSSQDGPKSAVQELSEQSLSAGNFSQNPVAALRACKGLHDQPNLDLTLQIKVWQNWPSFSNGADQSELGEDLT